jgi:SAM-dependent methyltransferase
MTIVLEKLAHCPLCTSTSFVLWTKAKDLLHQLSDKEFAYSKCATCRVVFQSERPYSKDIASFYPVDYSPYQPLGQDHFPAPIPEVLKNPVGFWDKILNVFLSSRKDKTGAIIESYYKPPSADSVFLDFGCGSADHLNRAKRLGWSKTIGMDFVPQAIAELPLGGHKAVLYDSELAWENIADASVDLIRMNHVVEHLYEPKVVLKALMAKLKKGGVLHIATPNPSGHAAQKFRKFWRGLDCPRHIMLYNPLVLAKIMKEDFGANQVRILQEVIAKDYARSQGFAWHAEGKLAHDQIEKLVYYRPYLEALRGRAKWAVLMGKADRYHLFITR